ncbi:ribosomal protein L11 methyltransferase PrmA [Reticulomyxa filosa]|uniref:Ribosomal protein L11 methyltransferase PrmA n=1 Tax=Reticulomyxa filosa TaxID=46433 RepID=X6MUZ7_RETFI|nr:ribosomal protein L11 methyltransferase PrmA [Reticulomyxa filosa]|eukprot:ETO17287.1 ribosomal protein L11 methyltransferase PrmA [Reticulomyxa filosa]
MLKLRDVLSTLQQVQGFKDAKVSLEQYPTPADIASHMCYLIQQRYRDLENKSVVDLGCGTGMLSVGAMVCGASHVTAIEMDPEAIEIALNNFQKLELANEIDVIQCNVCDFIPGLSQYIKKNSLKDSSDKHLSNKQKKAQRQKQKQKMKICGEKNSGNEAFTIDINAKQLLELQCTPDKFKHKWCDVLLMNPPFGTKNNKHIDLIFLKVALSMTRNVIYSLHKTSTRTHLLNTLQNVWKVKKVEVIAQLKFDIPNMYKFHKTDSKDIHVDIFRIEC